MNNEKVVEISKLSGQEAQKLLSLGVSRSNLKKFLHAQYRKGNDTFPGYAIANVFHGFECFTLSPISTALTSGRSGHIEIFEEDVQHEVCCVFYSIMDYLAYVYLRSISPLPLIDKVDCFIMCNPKNYFSLTVNTDGYQRILLFLPNTIFGKTISLTLEQRNPGHVKDCSFFYGNYETLRDLCKDWIKDRIV